MLSQNLSCHLLVCAAVMLVSVASLSDPEDGLEEDCKFLYNPYATQCINPNETIREMSSTRGLATVCSTSLSHRVVDTKKGTVEFSILLPHDAANEWIYLFALEPLTGEDQTASCSLDLHGKHSYFQLLEESEKTNCSSDQLMKITWKANYLYSGCYLVKADLPSPEPENNCTSEPFYIHTDFVMEPFAYQNLSVTRKSINQHLFANFYFGKQFHHNYPKTTIVKLSSNNTYPGKKFACCITGSFTEHCHWLRQDAGLSLECSCDWKKPQLECTFLDLPVGNYCVQVEAIDTRCVRDTVWVSSSLVKKMNNMDPCVWEICNLEIKNDTGRYLPSEYPKRSPVSWLIVVFAMGAVAAVCVSLYLRARRNLIFHRPNTANVEIHDSPCQKLIEPPQVLLLYARDCLPFMDAMVEFRILLQRTMDVRVFDIWDDRQREEIDANGDTWLLNNISSESTQVIFMATPVSRVFEDGFLSGNKRNYFVPQSRDDIFLSAFHTTISMAATHDNRCRKFIVARMNCVGCTENILTSFKPLCTIYTLPSHLDRLLQHVFNAPMLHNSPGIQRFEERFRRKAEEFEKFVSTNPSYLDSIIK